MRSTCDLVPALVAPPPGDPTHHPPAPVTWYNWRGAHRAWARQETLSEAPRGLESGGGGRPDPRWAKMQPRRAEPLESPPHPKFQKARTGASWRATGAAGCRGKRGELAGVGAVPRGPPCSLLPASCLRGALCGGSRSPMRRGAPADRAPTNGRGRPPLTGRARPRVPRAGQGPQQWHLWICPAGPGPHYGAAGGYQVHRARRQGERVAGRARGGERRRRSTARSGSEALAQPDGSEAAAGPTSCDLSRRSRGGPAGSVAGWRRG